MTELLKALRKARSEFPPVVKDQENPFFHSKYAALDSIIRAVTPALDENELTLLAGFEVVDGKSAVWMELHHDSGESMPKSTLLIPVKRTTKTDSETGEVTLTEDNPQEVGSGISYMVRYSIKTYLGLPLEDDDGNRASGSRRQQREEDPKAATLANIQKGEEALSKKLVCHISDLRNNHFGVDGDITGYSLEKLQGYESYLEAAWDAEEERSQGKSDAGEQRKLPPAKKPTDKPPSGDIIKLKQQAAMMQTRVLRDNLMPKPDLDAMKMRLFDGSLNLPNDSGKLTAYMSELNEVIPDE